MSKPAIACFGIGNMGQAIASRLLSQGYTLYVWNRSSEKAVPLMAEGAILSGSIDENIRSASVVLSLLPNAAAVQEVLLDHHWAHELTGRTIIQTGHLVPSRSNAMQDAFEAHGAEYVEAPLIGSFDDASTGQLTALLGCSAALFQKWRPLISAFARQIHYVGEAGQASALKLALVQLNTAMLTAFASSLGLLQSSRVSTDQFMELLRCSSDYAPLFDQKLQRLLDRDYEQPQGSLSNMLQDTKLLSESLEDAGVNAPFIEGLQDILNLASLKGLDSADTASMNEVVFPPRD